MDILKSKIQQLGKEADALVQRKMELEQEAYQIETRLTQIVGALTELKNVESEYLNRGIDNEISKDSGSRVHEGVQEASESTAADEDSISTEKADS